MRFEIRGGGAFLILAGLIGLSGAVFALGLVAGYEMARQNQPDLSQISTTYPLPSPPAPESTPAPEAASSPAAASAPALVAIPRASAAEKSIPPASGSAAAIPPAARPAPKASAPAPAAIARLKPPAEVPALKPPPAQTNPDSASEETASIPRASATAAISHKPFNIQIEAVMDKSGADEMVTRLRALGYNAQQVSIILGGETWYRVRVGPYNTQEEAKAAQDRLREQYKQAYTGPR